jgi:peptidoglycan glycosyltransferase
VVVVAILKFVRSVRDLDRYRYLTLLAAIFLLVLPLTPHFGEDIGGARLWVHVGSLTAEPVEFAKILLVFFFASYFSSNREVLSTATRRLGPFRIVSPKALLPILFAWLFCLGVLGAENNLGFAILIFMLFLCMLWVTTGLKTYVVGGLGGLIGSGYVAGNFFRQIHQRISVWLDPWSSANFHASNQIAYGWFSLAAGGITGTGLGLGRSGNIGEITSDMITAALGEELGFIGIVVILCLYAAFVGESFRIAQRTSSDFVRLAATGLTVLMGLQPFFIMAGVMRLIPFTGMALPFMSAGGSSLVANYAIVALLLRMSDENATARQGGAVISLNA